MNPDTIVINSRPHKKLPTIWRRRRCMVCHTVFTTDESPRVAAAKHVLTTAGAHAPYNPGILLLSIARAFQHDPPHGAEVAWDITQTISSKLAFSDGTLTTDVISDMTYDTLLRFDPAAATQYALQHGITLTRAKRK